jgi:CBS domain-containing protein
MKCGELMTRAPVVCAADDDCATAASLLDDHDVGSLPVVQSREVPQVIGIVTDRDLCCRVLAPDARASATCVRDVMSPDVLCCTEDDDVEEALGVMEARQVRRVPIVDDAGECVGIVTMTGHIAA